MFAILLMWGILAALVIWLGRIARELSQRQKYLSLGDKQLIIHSILQAKARDGPEIRQAPEQLELSRAIYRNVAAEFKRSISQTPNRLLAQIPAYISVPEVKASLLRRYIANINGTAPKLWKFHYN